MKSLLPMTALAALMLCACGDAALPPIPSGEQTIEGILQPAELSAVRRGSHMLLQDGIEVYYVESSLVNLREYQGKRTTLRGLLEHNTDPTDLPVLVVESVVDVEETVEQYDFSGWGVSFDAPIHWEMVKREGKYQFRLPDDGEDPLLVVWQQAGDSLPDGGVPIVIDASRASRLTDELSGTQIISVDRDGFIFTLRFTPGSRSNADRLFEDFTQLLDSISLKSTKAVDPTPSFGTGSLGQPCGGSAGILCPDGYFCDVQSFEDNVGKCRKL